MGLRGLDLTVSENIESQRLNKWTKAENSIQVINTIAYATGMISYEKIAAQEHSLETGDVSLANEMFESMLKKLVRNVPIGVASLYWFTLIPLVFVMHTEEKGWEARFSLLIKCQPSEGCDCYVDMTGRVYKSFRKFLKRNTFPRGILCYPANVIFELDDQNNVKIEYTVVDKAEKFAAILNKVVAVIYVSCLPFFPITSTVLMLSYTCIRKGVQSMTLKHRKFPDTVAGWSYIVKGFMYFIDYGLQILIDADYAQSIFGSVEFLLQENSWSQMPLDHRTKFAFSICFCNHVAPSLENGKRELEEYRIKTLCKTYKLFVNGSFNEQLFEELMVSCSSDQSKVAALLFLARTLIKHNSSIALTEDFATIMLGDRKLRFKCILKLANEDIRELGNIIEKTDDNLENLFSMLIESFEVATTVQLFGEREYDEEYMKTLCKTYKQFVSGSFNEHKFRRLVLPRSSDQSKFDALLFLASKLIDRKFTVALSRDFAKVKIGDRKLLFRRILQLTREDIKKLGNVFEQIDENLDKLFSMLCKSFKTRTTWQLLAPSWYLVNSLSRSVFSTSGRSGTAVVG
ncbi:uncharacterized protein LOC135711475 [Ochlerotatus camptorhynchus]|uniref:uncharacterized protein LOC135711475 n=1 Tax=Ochlerotatus camptorhynchus TaxID=644619 RepID=UPI0031CF7916